VNGTKVNIPSYRVKSGDVISVRATKRAKGPWKELAEQLKNHQVTSWLTVDPVEMTVKVSGVPTDEEVKNQPFDVKPIVEFYSR
jgi:small subunit ribosomal protein S4